VGDALEARRVALRVELAEVSDKVRRLTKAIETGGADAFGPGCEQWRSLHGSPPSSRYMGATLRTLT
jgi:hypothetical protein